MRKPNFSVNLDEDEREALQQLVRKRSEKQSLVLRAKIILLADEGHKYQDIAQRLGVRGNTVSVWTARWSELDSEPVYDRLQDRPRPGAPDTFTPAQLCQIIALACESPSDYGRPITHWTHRELTEEVIKQGIVESISSTYLGRLLKKRRTTAPEPILAQCKSG